MRPADADRRIIEAEALGMAARKALTDPFDLSQVTANASEQSQDLSTFIADPELRFTGVPRVTVKIRLERNR